MKGTRLKDWVCHICGAVGMLRLDGMLSELEPKMENRAYVVEVTYGDASPNSLCLKCRHPLYVVETSSY